MLHDAGVEVYIKSLPRQKPFMEYIKPNYNEAQEGKDIKRFIAVDESGEQFVIVVIFTEKFFRAPRDAPDAFPGGVNIFRRIDDDAAGDYKFFDRLYICKHPRLDFKQGNHFIEETRQFSG